MSKTKSITRLASLVCLGVLAVTAQDGFHTSVKKHDGVYLQGQGRGLISGIVGAIEDVGLGITNDIKKAAVYASLKVVLTAFDVALKVIGDCIRLPNLNIPVDTPLFSRIETGKGKVCGIGNIKPTWHYDTDTSIQTLLTVVMPFKVPRLKVYFRNFTVPNFIEGESLIVKIKKVYLKAEIAFKVTSILKFIRFTIQVTKLEDFDLKFTSKKSRIMEMVEGMSDTIGKEIRKTINKKFKKFQYLVYDAIYKPAELLKKMAGGIMNH